MNANERVLTQHGESLLAINKVVRNTYMMLSMTLLFSALTAALSMSLQMGPMTHLVSLVAAIALLWFVLPRTANSAAGVAVVFAFTGLMGFGLGPVLNHYLQLANGGQIITMALAGTGTIFLALSGYVLVSRKNFSFMGGFLFVGLLVLIGASLVGLFVNVPGLHLAISAAVILLFSGFILYDTSSIIHGGQTNYLLATVALYLDIYNIFVHLLSLLSAFAGER